MARASIIQTNFSGGELSPALALGRVDIAKYNNGAKRIENCVLTVQGGVKRRPGSRYIEPVKNLSETVRLIDFIYNRGQAYVLEMGNGYMRFFRNRQRLAVEVSSPFVTAQIPSVNYVQKSDTAFFVHEQVYPYRLQRFSDTQWGLGAVPFITPPFEEQGHYPPVSLSLDSTVVGAFVNATTPSAAFLPSDIGRHITFGGGDLLITDYVSATFVAGVIATPFPTLAMAAGQWNLTGSPLGTITPSAVGTVGGEISLSSEGTALEAAIAFTEALRSSTNTVELRIVGHPYATGDFLVISDAGALNGSYNATKIDANFVQIQYVAVDPSADLMQTGKVQRSTNTGGIPVWRTEDIGSYVEINGGLVRITRLDNDRLVYASVLRPLTAPIAVGPNGWVLSSTAWNEVKGYPRAVTLNQQRLMFGGSPGYPQNIWASEIQAYYSFSFGTDDDQAFRFELDGPRNSPIRHIAPARKLLVLTESDEMTLDGTQDKPITPTNIQKTDQSTVGSSQVRPVKVANEMIFLQAAGKKIAAAGYRYDIDGVASPDRTVFSSHITGTGIVQLAHQKDPDSLLYAVRRDGQMAACAYDIDQEVTGWARWITQGAYESIATVPTPTGEDAYAVVRRDLPSGTRRFVEVFDAEMFVDCGITGSNPAGQTTWTGLDHLEGATVQVRADGAYAGDFTVTDGAVTLSRPAKEVQIGLGFSCAVDMLPPEVGGNGTTAQGSQIHVNEVIIRVLDTQAALINGEKVEFRRFGPDLLDQPPPIYSGDLRKTTLSDAIYQTKQLIEQPYPMPFHLLDVIRRVTINE